MRSPVREMMKLLETRLTENHTHVVKPYTIVELVAEVGEKRVRGVGISRCGRNDTWNEEVGYQIARGRALKDAAKHAQRMHF